MKKFIKPAIFIVIGIIVAFPLFSISYYTMVRTSTPDFCASCHEIKPAVVAWRSSTHTNNASGVVVDCMDCHLPAPANTFDFFFAKTYHPKSTASFWADRFLPTLAFGCKLTYGWELFR
jgi:cytochrome c-type protein NapC/trimethylamine-N-oxide reductase cytochrome c-type subunit TorC